MNVCYKGAASWPPPSGPSHLSPAQGLSLLVTPGFVCALSQGRRWSRWKEDGGVVVTAGLLRAPGERRRLLTLDKLGKNHRAGEPGKRVGLGSGCEMGCTARPGPGRFEIALAPWDEGCVKASRGVVCFPGPLSCRCSGVQVFWVCPQFTLTASLLCLRVTWPFLQAWQHFALVTFWAPMSAGPPTPRR